MSSPKGKWKIVDRNHFKNSPEGPVVLLIEHWSRESDDEEIHEWHFHLPDGVNTIVVTGYGGEDVKLMTKQPLQPCICGAFVKVPDWNRLGNFADPKMKRAFSWAFIKHMWDAHRESYPPELKNVTQFSRWLKTPEGKTWEEKVYTKYKVMSEVNEILHKQSEV
jgi:hypothetical protein